MASSNTLVVLFGKKYAFDLNKVKEFCLVSDKEKGGEVEIVEVYEPLDGGNLTTSNRTVRELKSQGNPQNDTINYDLVKMFITTILTAETKTEQGIDELDFATKLAFNTLLGMGIIYEIKD